MTHEHNYLFNDVADLNLYMESLCDTQLLCVLQLNVQRISNINKFHNLLTYIASMTVKPDVLIFTETWITRGTEGLYRIPGYESLHCCRDVQSAGIALYYNTDLQCELIAQSNEEVSYMHVNLCRLSEPDHNLLITAIYMPDVMNFPLLDARLNNLMSNTASNHLLMGDFNVNILQSNSMTKTYVDTITALGYTIRNTFPTRPSSGTLIDHVITNFDDAVCITLSNDLSDHNSTIVMFDCMLSVRPSRGYTTICRTRTDFNGVREDMGSISLDELNAESSFTHIHQCLIESISRNTKTVILKVKNNNPYATSWVNESLIKFSKRKHRLLKKRNAGVISSTLNFRIETVSRIVTELKQQLRDTDKLSKFGPNVSFKTKWKNLNLMLGRKKKTDTISRVVNCNGQPVTELKSIADSFNNFFAGVQSTNNINQQLTESQEMTEMAPISMFFDPTTSQEVSSVIHNLKMKKSVGYDAISTSVVKNCESVLSPLLATSFNHCISEGYFPAELKISKVVPVFKKGDPSDVNNYRPISILPILNKVFEKLIYVRLLGHLDRFDYFYKRQYGFRARSNTSGCAIDLMDYVYGKIDASNIVTSVFLDLSKAFDTVRHDLLLEKLECCGVRGIANDLFRNYLSDRKQFVMVNDTRSDPLPVSRGVPQGSILGPLLFLIYVNGIAKLHLKGKLFLFADDTAILYSSPSSYVNAAMAETDLLHLNNFFKSNGLSLNVDKTKVMHFRTSRNTNENIDNALIRLGNEILETVDVFKYLGLVVDSHLTWVPHIDYVSMKIRHIIAIMYRAKSIIPRDVRRLIYFAMIHSQFKYMVELWGSAPMLHLKRLQILQNRVVRNILELPYLTARESLFNNQEFDILPIKGIYESSLATFVFKRIKGLVLSELNFETFEHSYPSRGRLNLRRPKCRLDISQRRVSYSGPIVFNKLPPDCKASTSIHLFKKKCFASCKANTSRYLQY